MDDLTLWMPKQMPDEEKARHAERNPGDPHGAAADAWDSWAAQQDPEIPGVRSVSTGAQSVTYDGPVTVEAQARARANWHRARSKVRSVEVGPTFAVLVEREPAVIHTVDSPSRPPA